MSDRLEELYRRFGPAIYSRCRRILGAGRAEDAVQEVFLRAHRHLEKIPDHQDALRWLYRVSTNYCLNVLRSQKRQTSFSANPEEAGAQRVEASQEAPRSLEKTLLDKDLVQYLLQRMPVKVSQAAMLYYLDDMEQKQVAQVLGITNRTVINRLQEFNQRACRILGRT